MKRWLNLQCDLLPEIISNFTRWVVEWIRATTFPSVFEALLFGYMVILIISSFFLTIFIIGRPIFSSWLESHFSISEPTVMEWEVATDVSMSE